MAESDGWACVDCAMLIANGETPPEMSEEATSEWLAEIERRTGGLYLGLGDDYDEFSWSACDACGSNLGGSRHSMFAFDTGKVGN